MVLRRYDAPCFLGLPNLEILPISPRMEAPMTLPIPVMMVMGESIFSMMLEISASVSFICNTLYKRGSIMCNVYSYTRISTSEERNLQKFIRQESALQRYAKENSMEYLLEFKEDKSGKNFTERKQW